LHVRQPDTLPEAVRVILELGVHEGEVAWEEDLVPLLAVGQQQHAQQILLRVVSALPFRRIVVRQIDIVDVDEHTGLQPGQDLEENHGDVAVLKAPVRAVDHQDVVLFDEKSLPAFGPIAEIFRNQGPITRELNYREVEIAGLFEAGATRVVLAVGTATTRHTTLERSRTDVHPLAPERYRETLKQIAARFLPTL